MSKIAKKSIELTPGSRIRREPPVKPVSFKETVLGDDPQQHARTVVIGVLMFAIAINILIFWISDYTSH